MRRARTLGAVAMTLAMAGGLSVAAQTTASATGSAPVRAADTCSYPYVCLFKNGTKIGQFQDVTSGFQNLPSRPSGPNLLVQNTRNDDVVYLRPATGSIRCVSPRKSVFINAGALTGIRISSSPTC